jgi:hypothetical protein
LLDKDYLSLAEVQVMGVDPLRFAEVDYSPPEFRAPHTLIEPSALRAAKEDAFE